MDTVTVKTSGSFMLIDISTGVEIEPLTETPDVPLSPFIERALRDGRLVDVNAKPAKEAPSAGAPTSGRASKAKASE